MTKKLVLMEDGKIIDKNIKKLEKAMGLKTTRKEKLLGKCPHCKNNTLFWIQEETPSYVLLGISFWIECKKCGYKGPTGFAD